MKKLIFFFTALIFLSTEVYANSFMKNVHKSNAKKSQQACFKNDKWAGKSCNTAGKIWLNRLNNKEKALKWFKIGCEKKGYFRACSNYKKYSGRS